MCGNIHTVLLVLVVGSGKFVVHFNCGTNQREGVCRREREGVTKIRDVDGKVQENVKKKRFFSLLHHPSPTKTATW